MNELGPSPTTRPFWASAAVGLADRTMSTPAHIRVGGHRVHGHTDAGFLRGAPHESEISLRTTVLVAKAKAKAEEIWTRTKTSLLELKPRRRPTEEEVVRAAIAVILVALMAIIWLAAGAILTMG